MDNRDQSSQIDEVASRLRGELKPSSLVNLLLLSLLLLGGGIFFIMSSLQLETNFVDRFRRLDPAVRQFSTAVQLEPTKSSAYIYLAEAYQLQGDLNAIQNVWERAITANSHVKWPYQHIANFYNETSQSNKVSQVWQLAIENNLDKPWSYISLSDFYLSENNEPAALAVWQKAIRLNPSEVWPYTRLAGQYKANKNWSLVEGTYQRLIQEQPDKPLAYQLLANHFFARKNWIAAQNMYETSLSLDPSSPSVHLNLGRTLLRLEQIPDAIENFGLSISLNPTQSYLNAIKSDIGVFPLDEQIDIFEQILTSTLDNFIIHNTVVRLHLDAGNCESAVGVAEQGILNMQSENAYKLFGDTLRQCKQETRAIEVFQEAIILFPFSDSFPLAIGNLQLKSGSVREAIQMFAQSLQLNETPAAFQKVAKAYSSSLTAEQSMEAMVATIAIAKPKIMQPYSDLVGEYNALGQSEDAISVLLLAASINPKEAWVYQALARQYTFNDRINEALSAYEQAIVIDPDNSLLHFRAARLLIEQKEYPVAIQLLEIAHDLDSENTAIQTQLAGAYFFSGKYERGADLLELIYNTYQSNSTYNYMRSVYKNTLSWPDSQPYQERAAQLRWPETDGTPFRNLASWYSNDGQVEAAKYNYQKALAADPENTKTLNQITRFSLTQSDCKAANEYGLQATKIDPSSATYLQLADVYAQCGPPEALEIAQRRSVENYLVERAPQSNKNNAVDQTIRRFRDILTEKQVVAYLNNMLTTLELDRAEPYTQLGWYYESITVPPRPQQAIMLYERATELHPDNFRAAAALGRMLQDDGMPEESLKHYRKAILLNQNEQSVRVRYGRALVETGEVEQGKVVLSSALKLEQSDWYTNYALEGYWTSLPPATALRYITETLTLVPSNSEEVYMPSARYYLDIGDTESAVDILTLASESNPQSDWPHVKLSYIYRNLQKYAAAFEQMQIAIQKQPRVAWNHNDLGLLYREKGNLDAALLSLDQAVRLEPENAWYHINYGQALLEDGQAESGGQQLILALQAEESEAVYTFVDALFRRHLSKEDAQSTYQFLIENEPENELAQQYLLLWLED